MIDPKSVEKDVKDMDVRKMDGVKNSSVIKMLLQLKL